MFDDAQAMLPGGMTHDSRWLRPFPVYVERAEGAHKWTVDGVRLIDYWMGHGSLMLGHGHHAVARAVQEQLARGTHYGAAHPLELEWARWITRLVPGVERVRFTSSGTEATQLAMRLARVHTGRARIARFTGHFHGWHDEAVGGKSVESSRVQEREKPGTAAGSAKATGQTSDALGGARAAGQPAGARGSGVARSAVGVPESVHQATVALPVGDVDALRRTLAAKDVAALIVEPSGGGWGAIPMERSFLELVREETYRTGTLLIFDEIITGFRLAPGGAQEYYGIHADIVCLGKIAAGGLPGAAVAGPAEIMAYLEFRDDAWNRTQKIPHQGTFNANPLTAAAAVATLKELADGKAIRRAEALCDRLGRGLNKALVDFQVRGYVYWQSSMFHIAMGLAVEDAPEPIAGAAPRNVPAEELERLSKGEGTHWLRKAMLIEGVDLMRSGGFLSAAHTETDVDETIQAFRRALARLKDARFA